MTRQQRAMQAFFAAKNEARRNGINPNRGIGLAHALATGYLAFEGYDEPARPDITSGRRSVQRQRELIEMWDDGQRAGFIGQPARCSKHTAGAAIDVQTSVRGFSRYRQYMNAFGARDGANFGDLGHFDDPTKDGYCI